MRQRRQKIVLEPVGVDRLRARVFGALEETGALVLEVLPARDVQRDAAHADRPPVVVEAHGRVRLDPQDGAVLADPAEFAATCASALEDGPCLGRRARPIVGMDHVQPEVRRPRPLFRLVPEHRADVIAHEIDALLRRVGLPPRFPDDARDVGDDGGQAMRDPRQLARLRRGGERRRLVRQPRSEDALEQPDDRHADEGEQGQRHAIGHVGDGEAVGRAQEEEVRGGGGQRDREQARTASAEPRGEHHGREELEIGNRQAEPRQQRQAEEEDDDDHGQRDGVPCRV